VAVRQGQSLVSPVRASTPPRASASRRIIRASMRPRRRGLPAGRATNGALLKS
jgi:hypothetical protein